MKLCITVQNLPEVKMSVRLKRKPTAACSVNNIAAVVINLRLSLHGAREFNLHMQALICKLYKKCWLSCLEHCIKVFKYLRLQHLADVHIQSDLQK